MPPLILLAWIFGWSLSEWLTVLTVVFGTGLVGNGYALWQSARKLRRESRVTIPAEMRTVAIAESETAMHIMGEVITELRRQLNECQEWRAGHSAVCPLLGGGDDDR